MKVLRNVNETYYLNECTKTVVCVTTGVLTVFDCVTPENDIYTKSISVKCIGKAQCSNTDKFDHIIGRKIASSRAKAKLMKKVKKVLTDYNNVYTRLSEEALSAYKKYDNIEANELARITEHL